MVLNRREKKAKEKSLTYNNLCFPLLISVSLAVCVCACVSSYFLDRKRRTERKTETNEEKMLWQRKRVNLC